MKRCWLYLPLWLLVASPAVAAVKVTLQGIDGELADNARAYLSIANLPPDAGEARVRRAHHRAPGEIRESLQPLGYYRPKIESRLQSKKEDWQAVYRVDPGPAMVIDTLEIRIVGGGADDPRFQRAIERGGLAKGQRLRHARYEQTKTYLQEATYAGGYLDAEFVEHRLLVDTEVNRAQVRIVLDTGPSYFFGEIKVHQDILNDDLMRRYIGIQEGEPFDPQRLLKAQYRLNDSGYFERIEISVDKKEAENRRVPVTVKAIPRPKHLYTVGAGFGTDTGPRGRLGVEWRRLNRRGHRAEIQLRASAVQTRLTSQYLIPVTNTSDNRYAIRGIVNQGEVGDGESDKLLVGASRDRPLGAWQGSAYLNFERESSRFTDDVDRSFLLTPGVSLSRSSSDDALFPRHGWSLFFDVHAASDDLVSSVSLVQTRLNGRGILSLSDNVRLLLRSDLGVTFANKVAVLPASQRFFAGGDRSVRGYGYEELGERNDEGDVIGGRYLFTASAEVDWWLLPKWGVAAFYDLGNAADSLDAPLKRGVGIGLRWRSPVGPLRLDLAHPVDEPDRSVRLHITIGPYL